MGFGTPRHEFSTLPSTQAAALEGAAAGAPEGSLYLACAQTQGRGRHGHGWASVPDAGIYASVVLRPARPAAALLTLTLASGLAIADGVAAATGLEPALRWPNDLLLGGRKFCGILLESAGEAAVLGFGINLRANAVPPKLAGVATALDLHCRGPVGRDGVLAAALEHLERRYRAWAAGNDRAMLEEFEARCPLVRDGAVVVGGSTAAPCKARTEGLDELGFLRVRREDGSRGLVVNGDVRPR